MENIVEVPLSTNPPEALAAPEERFVASVLDVLVSNPPEEVFAASEEVLTASIEVLIASVLWIVTEV